MNVPDTPCLVPVRLVCPDCSQALQVEMAVTTQLTVEEDSDGVVTRVLAPKVKRQTIGHVCGQRTLDDAMTIDGRTVDADTGEVLRDAVDETARRVNSGELGPNVTAYTDRVVP